MPPPYDPLPLSTGALTVCVYVLNWRCAASCLNQAGACWKLLRVLRPKNICGNREVKEVMLPNELSTSMVFPWHCAVIWFGVRRKQQICQTIRALIFWLFLLTPRLPVIWPASGLFSLNGQCPSCWRCVTGCVYVSKVAGSLCPSPLRLPDCWYLVSHGTRSLQFIRRERMSDTHAHTHSQETRERSRGRVREKESVAICSKHKCVSKTVCVSV